MTPHPDFLRPHTRWTDPPDASPLQTAAPAVVVDSQIWKSLLPRLVEREQLADTLDLSVFFHHLRHRTMVDFADVFASNCWCGKYAVTQRDPTGGGRRTIVYRTASRHGQRCDNEKSSERDGHL